MKRIIILIVFLMSAASTAFAGNLYGTITEGGKPIAKGVKLEIACGPKNYSTESDANGAFKVFVAESGKCTLKIDYQGQTPSFEVSSYEGSVQYDLILEKKDGKYTIKRK